MTAKPKRKLETEPIFSIHIDFSDGSQPIDYHSLSLARALDALKEWSENWILSPDPDCKLNDAVWKWHARPRGQDFIDLMTELAKTRTCEPDDEDDLGSVLDAPLMKEE